MKKTSHSSRGTFRACKRRHHWSYTVGIEPNRKSKALRMGSAWSDALEHGKHVLRGFYRDSMHTALEWEIDDLAHELRVLEALHDTYPYGIDELREVPFEHVNEELGYTDRGYLDGLKPVDDRVIIVENKLYARFGDMEKQRLEFDEQVTSYVAALCDGDVDGFPDGIIPGLVDVNYNVTLKPALRKKVGETDESFTARCVADIYARPDHYHKQIPLNRGQEELDDFRSRRDKHAIDLAYEEKMDVWERNPAACFDYGQCPFLKICRQQNVDAVPEGYVLKEERT